MEIVCVIADLHRELSATVHDANYVIINAVKPLPSACTAHMQQTVLDYYCEKIRDSLHANTYIRVELNILTVDQVNKRPVYKFIEIASSVGGLYRLGVYSGWIKKKISGRADTDMYKVCQPIVGSAWLMITESDGTTIGELHRGL